MKATIFLLVLVLTAAAFFVCTHSPSLAASSDLASPTPKPKAKPKPSPKPSPDSWPDLTKINVGGGKMCSIDGAGTTAEKKALNDLKNRFRLPSGNFEPTTFDQLLALTQGH